MREESAWQKYGFAIAATSVSLVLRLVVAPWAGESNAFALFYPVVIFSAWYGGFGPGLLATILSAISVAYFFLAPINSFQVADNADFSWLMIFLVVGIFISWMSGSLKLAQQISQNRHQECTEIIEAIGDTFFALNEDRQFSYVNAQAGRFIGKEREEILGKLINQVMPGEFGKRLTEKIELATKEQKTINYEHFDSDLEKWWIVRIYPSAQQVSVFIEDITEQKQARRKSRQDESSLQAIFSQAAVGIAKLDINGQFSIINERFCHLIGCEMKNVSQKKEYDFVHPEDLEKSLAEFEQTKKNGAPHTLSKRYMKPDKTVVWVNTSTAILKDENEKPESFVIVAQDISDLKRTEKALAKLLIKEQQARTTAEQASLIKDEFLATVSHELRTPLTSILGWTRMLRAEMLDEGEQKHAFEIIERNVQSQAQMVEDLLDVSRIITGKMSLQMRAVNLVGVIDATINSVRSAADSKRIEVETVFETLAVPIFGDADRLQQILWNLLSNAIKFTPGEGRIIITLRAVGMNVEIQVSDTGIGIKPEILPYIFDRFRQADSSTTRSYGGLGLGLSLVWYLVQSHGGTINATSKGEGKGATFTVQLPLMRNQVAI